MTQPGPPAPQQRRARASGTDKRERFLTTRSFREDSSDHLNEALTIPGRALDGKSDEAASSITSLAQRSTER